MGQCTIVCNFIFKPWCRLQCWFAWWWRMDKISWKGIWSERLTHKLQILQVSRKHLGLCLLQISHCQWLSHYQWWRQFQWLCQFQISLHSCHLKMVLLHTLVKLLELNLSPICRPQILHFRTMLHAVDGMRLPESFMEQTSTTWPAYSSVSWTVSVFSKPVGVSQRPPVLVLLDLSPLCGDHCSHEDE